MKNKFNPKRVLFIVTKSEIGGAQKFVKEQIEILNEAGFECFLATNKNGWLLEQTKDKINAGLVDEGIEKISLKYLIRLRKFILSQNVQLVICSSANGGLYGRIGAFITGVGSIYVSHGWSSIYNGGKLSFLYNKVELFLSYIGNSVLCISKNDYSTGWNKIGVSKKKLHVITNCIKPVFVQDRLERNLSDTDIVKIIAVARMEYPKRIDLLIDAVKGVPDVHLSIVGDGKQFEAIKLKTEHMKNVQLLGRIDGFEAFGDYDIFALISESEGLPLSALEAMSCGNALVLSNVGGCKELINKNGVVVENDSESILNGIHECIQSLPLYKSNSLKLFDNEFNLNTNKMRYIDYYNNIVKW